MATSQPNGSVDLLATALRDVISDVVHPIHETLERHGQILEKHQNALRTMQDTLGDVARGQHRIEALLTTLIEGRPVSAK